jgi:hypothetical protein
MGEWNIVAAAGATKEEYVTAERFQIKISRIIPVTGLTIFFHIIRIHNVLTFDGK